MFGKLGLYQSVAVGAVVVSVAGWALYTQTNWFRPAPIIEAAEGPLAVAAGVEDDDAQVVVADETVAIAAEEDSINEEIAAEGEPDAVADVAAVDEGDGPEAVSEVQSDEPVLAIEIPVPTFDVVRVETDGMTVVAGTGPAGWMISILVDGVVVETVQADSSGQFVAIFDMGEAATARVVTLSANNGDEILLSVAQVIIAPVVRQVAVEEDVTPVAETVETVDLGVAEANEEITESVAEVEATPELTLTETEVAVAVEAGAVNVEVDDATPEAVVADDTGTVLEAEVASVETTTETTTATVVESVSETLPQAAEIVAALGDENTEATEAVANVGAQDDATQEPVDVAASIAIEADETAADETVSVEADGIASIDVPEPAVTEPNATEPNVSDPIASEPDAEAMVTPVASAVVDPETTVEDPATEVEVVGNAAPAVILVDESGVSILQSASNTPQVLDQLSIAAISYSDAGEVQISGFSPAGFLRVYLNNVQIAVLEVPEPGQWQTELADIEPGIYTLRIDQVDGQGAVVHRVETPFKREEPEKIVEASQSRKPLVSVEVVQPGATLWAISRETYGSGVLYVNIFEANKDQIRNPHLIYPGQIFELPAPPGAKKKKRTSGQ